MAVARKGSMWAQKQKIIILIGNAKREDQILCVDSMNKVFMHTNLDIEYRYEEALEYPTHFEEQPKQFSMVRIKFGKWFNPDDRQYYARAFAAVGTQCLYYHPNQATANLSQAVDEREKGNIAEAEFLYMHEAMHISGFEHEHERKDSGIPWIDSNGYDKSEEDGFDLSIPYDPDSITHYPVASYIHNVNGDYTSGPKTNNYNLSKADILSLQKYYNPEEFEKVENSELYTPVTHLNNTKQPVYLH